MIFARQIFFFTLFVPLMVVAVPRNNQKRQDTTASLTGNGPAKPQTGNMPAKTIEVQQPFGEETKTEDESENGKVISSGGTIEQPPAENGKAASTAGASVPESAGKTTQQSDVDKPTRCWANWNGHENNASWVDEHELVDRSGLYYECRAGKLIAAGCLDDNGKRVPLNGTFIAGRFLLQCVPWYAAARRSYIGCVPEDQQGKTYMQGQSWMDAEKHTWTECNVDGEWPAGCVDTDGISKLSLGERTEKETASYECQYRRSLKGYRLVPTGCKFNGTRAAIGQTWEDGEFVFYCKKQGTVNTAPTVGTTCIDCILRAHSMFDMTAKFLENQAERCKQRIDQTGNVQCEKKEE